MYNKKIIKRQFGGITIDRSMLTMLQGNPGVINPLASQQATSKIPEITQTLGYSGGGGEGGFQLGTAGTNILSSIGRLSASLIKNQTEEQAAIRSGINNIMNSTPLTAAISFGLNTFDAAVGLPKHMDESDAERYGVKGLMKFQDKAASIPGIGGILGLMSSKVDKGLHSDLVAQNSSDYGGVVANMEAAERVGENKYLGGKGINKDQKEFNHQTEITDQLLKESRLRKDNQMADLYNSRNQLKYSGGKQVYSLSAKEGMKFPELDLARSILSIQSTKQVKEFKEGGVIGTDKNFISGGKLHRELNHISNNNEELEGKITKKGVPVLDSNGDQCAEVEKEEIFLNKGLTSILEDYYKQYKDNPDNDELLIECGKLLVNELLKNTVDKSGLIKSIE